MQSNEGQSLVDQAEAAYTAIICNHLHRLLILLITASRQATECSLSFPSWQFDPVVLFRPSRDAVYVIMCVPTRFEEGKAQQELQAYPAHIIRKTDFKVGDLPNVRFLLGGGVLINQKSSARQVEGRNPDICASPPRPRPAELHGGARKGHGHCPPQEQYVCAHGQPESDVSGCLSE
eukprot:1159261-Pelagomonas_calceolata.AAC.4